LNFQEMKYYYL